MAPKQYHVVIGIHAFTWVTRPLWLSKAVNVVESVASVDERVQATVVRCGAPGIGDAPRECVQCTGFTLIQADGLEHLADHLRDHVKDVYGAAI